MHVDSTIVRLCGEVLPIGGTILYGPYNKLIQTIVGKIIGSACAITGLLGPFHIDLTVSH